MDNFIFYFRWIIGCLFTTLSITGIIFNCIYFVQSLINKKWISLAPFIGGIFGVFGILLLPVEGINKFWWIPLFLDLGCLPVLLWTLFYHLFHHRRRLSKLKSEKHDIPAPPITPKK